MVNQTCGNLLVLGKTLSIIHSFPLKRHECRQYHSIFRVGAGFEPTLLGANWRRVHRGWISLALLGKAVIDR